MYMHTYTYHTHINLRICIKQNWKGVKKSISKAYQKKSTEHKRRQQEKKKADKRTIRLTENN